jgi:tripartite ATP-independent transporter DctM subunit
MTALLGSALLALALAGAPLFVVMGGAALLLFWAADIDTSAVVIELYRMASAPTLVAIPLFTFAGYVLAESKAPKRIVDFCQGWFGWLPGGLSIVTLCACAFFTAFTGASGVTIIALGGLLYPVLIKEGYGERFSLGLMTTCGSLGLLFPPSLPIILYGLVAAQDIDKLFLAGVLPGVLLMLLLAGYNVLVARREAVPRTPFDLSAALAATRRAAWELPLPLILLGGIYGGYITATEAAAVTAFYVLIVECLIHRDVSITRHLPGVMRESMILIGGILVILGCALGLTSYLVDAEVPTAILDLMRQYIDSRLMFLVVLNVFLLIVGCMMDIFSAIVVVVPLITPIALEYGVDPIHLGIIFLTNLEIGYITPPVGINLFIASFRFEKKVITLYRAAVPFMLVLLAALLVITYVPDLSLTLVRLVYGAAGAGAVMPVE